MVWFSRVRNWVTDSGNGIGIRADYHDSEDDNFATGINLALNIAGGNSPTANIPFGGFKITGAASGTAATDYATVGQVQSRVVAYAADSVGTDLYAITLSPAITSYVVGQQFLFAPGTANTTTTPSLNVNGLGAKTLKKDKGAVLGVGELQANQLVLVSYDGTNFQMLSPASGGINQSGSSIYAADGGGSDSYVITLSPVPTAYSAGMMLNVKCNTANVGSATLNVNGLGAKSILKELNLALNDNDIKATQIIQVIYDGTNFQMISPASYLVSQDGHAIYAADAGSSDTYAITLSPAPPAYITGFSVRFKANTLNTGASTLNCNGLGAVSIRKFGTTINTETGDILAGQIVQVIYDGTNFQMISPVININNATAETTPVGADKLAIYDSVNAANRSITLSDLINGQVEDTTPDAAADYLMSYDASATTTKKVLFGNAGKLVLLQTNTSSTSAISEFNALFTSAYSHYVFLFDAIVPATDAVRLYCQLGTGATPTYATTLYNWGSTTHSSGVNYVGYSVSDTQATLSNPNVSYSISNTALMGVSGEVRLFGATASSTVVSCTGFLQHHSSSNASSSIASTSFNRAAATYTAIKFYMSSGNITSGKIRMYGVRNT